MARPHKPHQGDEPDEYTSSPEHNPDGLSTGASDSQGVPTELARELYADEPELTPEQIAERAARLAARVQRRASSSLLPNQSHTFGSWGGPIPEAGTLRPPTSGPSGGGNSGGDSEVPEPGSLPDNWLRALRGGKRAASRRRQSYLLNEDRLNFTELTFKGTLTSIKVSNGMGVVQFSVAYEDLKDAWPLTAVTDVELEITVRRQAPDDDDQPA
jgi:hypothetical protein